MLVRKQPFSVVLLDEFEKAHANVWDLFLQVFDDGRLTDQLGQVGDFRHCIIILTTNLGATSHRSGGIGFSPATDSFSGEQISRAVAQTFRPEFQNRLDKVIVFRPLTRELMRSILKKELSRVLERRGLKDREWAVEWEASALEFLLEKGFTPEMGARPLEARHRPVRNRTLGRHDCGEAVPRGRPVRVCTQRRARHPGRVRRSRRRDVRAGASSRRRARRVAGAHVDDAGPERQRCGARGACDGERGRRSDDAVGGMGAAQGAPCGGDAARADSGRAPTASRRSRDWR